MDSFCPSPAAFQCRLSRLYDDTKKSSDFVNLNKRDPAWKLAYEDPDIKVLHRKLRIQKDRLVTWGLEWCEPAPTTAAASGSADEIDDALARAGLSEIVGSVMTTIKEILAETEQRWLAFQRIGGGSSSSSSGKSEKKSEKSSTSITLSSSDTKPGLVNWDRGRFEDLIRDLTISIDTLYDLSRTRSATGDRSVMTMSKGAAKMADERVSAFETSRLQTPQQIDPAALTSMHQIKVSSSSTPSSEQESLREVVIMEAATSSAEQAAAATQHTPQLPSSRSQSQQPSSYHEEQKAHQQQPQQQKQQSLSKSSRVVVPLMLEYARFDSIYAATGIMPPMVRFEKLCSALQQETFRGSDSWSGLPALHGYFEDFEHSRLGLVYHFPPGFNAVSSEHTTQSTAYGLRTLRDLLHRPNFEPRLEARFRLALNLASTVFDLHSRTASHGNLQDTTVSFGNTASTLEPSMLQPEIDIRRPLVSSFELFDGESTSVAAGWQLHRHPLDPHNNPSSPLDPAKTDQRVLDLYSLAMLLVQVGLWASLEDLAPTPSAPVPESILDQLAVRCGSLYMKAAKVCWTAVEDELAGKTTGNVLLQSVQSQVIPYLETCCILDGVTGLERRLGHDLSSVSPVQSPAPFVTLSPPRVMAKDKATASSLSSSSSQAIQFGRQPSRPHQAHESTGPMQRPFSEPSFSKYASALAETRQAKDRLFNQVPLPPDTVHLWNTVTMSRVDSALRTFNRNHADESVAISLSSVGPSARQTVPTVLVTCSSVSLVRSILKRRLPDLFDNPSSGLALKVCRGSVIRSRGSVDVPVASIPGTKARTETVSASVSGPTALAPEPSASQVAAGAAPTNPYYQQIPKNGASIGAWIGHRHLPPVSFGGLIVVDGTTYGMTVHHMLDEAPMNHSSRHDFEPTYRSSAWHHPSSLNQVTASEKTWGPDDHDPLDPRDDSSSDAASDYGVALSDGGSDAYTDTEITDDYGSDDLGESDDNEEGEPGDVVGIEPGCGDGYIITQPALDDVDNDFYPSEETADEDHLDSFTVGDVYASSGIRRRHQGGLVHEIDWALFEFTDEDRVPRGNSFTPVKIQMKKRSRERRRPVGTADTTATAITITPSANLPGLAVQCTGRTSGFQIGTILPAITSLKIYGRITPSHAFEVLSTPTSTSFTSAGDTPAAIGLPGDSGAWVMDAQTGAVCGHVLAWSTRKRVAYICPMDVMLQDIAETLCAREIRLPGGMVLVRGQGGKGTRGSVAESSGKEVELELGREEAKRHAPAVPPPRRSEYSSSPPPHALNRHEDRGHFIRDKAPQLVFNLAHHGRYTT